MAERSLPVINPKAAKKSIEVIRALDLRSTTIEQIHDLLTPVFTGYKVTAPHFEAGLDLYRVRVCDKPHFISELSYPPNHLVPLGRVNRPEKPVLYCCTSREAPFFEAHPSEGQTVAIVHWKTAARLLVNHVGYSNATFKTLGSNRRQAGWDNEDARVPGDETNRFIMEFLAEAFTRSVPIGSEHEYKLSVAIAEHLYADQMFNGLLYPTIAMRANADNFALKLPYADTHLQFVKAEFARIDNLRDFAFDITVLDTATQLASDGAIMWKGRLDQWVIRENGGQLTLTVENNQWVARDASGHVVKPE